MLFRSVSQSRYYDYKKDMDEIKVRLAALEEAMKPKEEVKAEEAPKIVIEKEDEKEESVDMSEVVKKVLTEFGIKPIPASPVVEEAPAKKDDLNISLTQVLDDLRTLEEVISGQLTKKGSIGQIIETDQLARNKFKKELLAIEEKKKETRPFELLNIMIGDAQGKRFNEIS